MRIGFLLAAMLTASTAATAEDLQPGKYRTTLEIPGEKPVGDEQCITQKDIDSGLSKLGAEQDNEDCKVEDFKRTAGSVSYRLVCTEDGHTHAVETSGTFNRDSFDFRMTSRRAKGSSATMHVVGKRVGACK
jgi:hypothetical protein